MFQESDLFKSSALKLQLDFFLCAMSTPDRGHWLFLHRLLRQDDIDSDMFDIDIDVHVYFSFIDEFRNGGLRVIQIAQRAIAGLVRMSWLSGSYARLACNNGDYSSEVH
jgi:hypothetical protein